MPSNCEITNIYKTEITAGAGTFDFVVESRDFKELAEGETIPRVSPVLSWMDESKRPGNFIRFEWGGDGKQD